MFFEVFFFDRVATEKNHPIFIWYVLGNDPVVFPVLGFWVGEGLVSPGFGAQPAYAIFHPVVLKNGSNFFFDRWTAPNDHPTNVCYV